MEYPVLLEEVDQLSLAELVDKCRELRVYDEEKMESKADLRQALQQYIKKNPDEIDSSFHEVLVNTVQDLSRGYRQKLTSLKDLYDGIIQMVSETNLDEMLYKRMRDSFHDIVLKASKEKENLKRDIVPIVVAGEVSSGKGSFINNLIGEDLLSTKLQHSTAVICRIRYSEEKLIKLTNQHGQLVKRMKCKDASEAREYLKTYADQNSCQNECQYDFVDILWPVPFLKDTLEIVDTPGIDENTMFEKLVTEYINSAASVIYMIDAGNAGGLRERGVKKIKEIADIIFGTSNSEDLTNSDVALFVLNKWDCVNDMEKDDILNENLEKIRSAWPNLSESQVILLDSRKNKAIRLSKATGQRLYSRSFRELVSSVRYLIEKSFQQFISKHERRITLLLLNLSDTLSQNIRKLNKTSKEYARIERIQDNEMEALNQILKMFKEDILSQLSDIYHHQVKVVTQRFKDKSFCSRQFRFEDWELPAWYNYLNSSSKVWKLVEGRIPQVIENILKEDETLKGHMQRIALSLHEKLKEFTKYFMKSKLEARMSLGATSHVSSAGSMKITPEEALTVFGFGMGGSAIAARVFSRLSLTFMARLAGGSLSFLAGASSLGVVGFGLLAGVQSLTHGYNEYKYHENKHRYIVDLVPKVFQSTYLREHNSALVLEECIRKTYSEIRNGIDNIFDIELPALLDDNKNLLKNVYLDLLPPEEMEKDLEPLFIRLQALMRKIIALDAENKDLLVMENEIKSETPKALGEFYNTKKCIVASQDPPLSAEIISPTVQEKGRAAEGDFLLWLIACKELRSMETDTIGILNIKGLVEGIESSLKLIVMPWKWSLSVYLKTKRSSQDVSTTVLEVAEEITKGLHFLHSNELTHRCLTGANVKVNNGGEVKLIFTHTGYNSEDTAPHFRPCRTRDNDISSYEYDDKFPFDEYQHQPRRKIHRYRSNSRVLTSSFSSKNDPVFDEYPDLPTHLAPEFLLGRERLYRKEADIYSLGVLLWEISYDIRAFVCFTPLEPSSTMQTFLDFLDKGDRPKISYPHHVKPNENQLQDVIEKCWHHDPRKRSSAVDVLHALKKLKCVSKEIIQDSFSDETMYSSMSDEAPLVDF